MKTSSAKAKGRRACSEVADLLFKYSPDLQTGDIRITSSGACGEDLLLSPRALEKYPLVIECKNQEALNIWAALKQAEGHAAGFTILGPSDSEPGMVGVRPPSPHVTPVLFFRRNRSKLYVAMEADHFVRLIS